MGDLFVSFPQGRMPAPTEQELQQWPLVVDVYSPQVESRPGRITASIERPMTLVHQASEPK